MSPVYMGIDVGGTHTDGVAIADGRIVHKVKVQTTPDLRECTVDALRDLLDEVPPTLITRVVISTTLVTNAIVAGELEPTGMVLTAGPGMNPNAFAPDSNCAVAKGSVDHRGREIAPLDEEAVDEHLACLRAKGVRVLATVGKFSVRNPVHEQRVAEIAGPDFDHVVKGHCLSGSLNFPRRIATAYLAAGSWRQQAVFVRAMSDAMRRFGLFAPLYLLRADGGTQLASSVKNPAETALSGPAASIMGAAALDDLSEDTLTLDVGGTTTDVSLFLGGVPLLEARGATIGTFRTQIRSLYTRSIGAGGDSLVTVEGGRLKIGPRRLGRPASLGGTHPTPTDALVLLGRALGDRVKAAHALRPIGEALGLSVEATGRSILRALAEAVAGAAREFLEEVRSRPVYTIHEVLEGHPLIPRRAVAVGGPARAIAPYLEEALDLPVQVPDHFDVANAVGAALSRVNLEVNLLADSAAGHLAIPEVGVFRPIPATFTFAEAKREAERALLDLVREKGLLDPGAVAEVAEQESFNVVEGFATVGSIHRIRMQIRPGLVGKIAA
ncbi:MAG: hydantoinase/oxoprolinase family protein [Deltaproteobacteria bacterium]|nr:hydantoinase/oxoprolinase family protein [Deltaproteobacteria bacterium]